MLAHVVAILLSFFLSVAYSQSSAAACVVGPTPCTKFETVLIQTTTVNGQPLTTLVFNVTNYCKLNVYFVAFSIDSPASLAMKPPMILTPQVDYTQQYLAHYQWNMAKTKAKMNGDSSNSDFISFTPAAGTPGVSGNPPVQTSYMLGSTTGWSWEIFSFQVTGYLDPTYPWYWQSHVGDRWETFGPLDMSLCYCANCDAGYFQRLIQACDTGYLDPATTTYNDRSTNRSTSAFNENKVLYAFAIVGDWVQLFYSDEHALTLGYNIYKVNGQTQLDLTSRLPATPANGGACIEPKPPGPIDLGNTNFDGSVPLSNVDLNSVLTGCAAGPLCGRPMPPSLFVTDTTSNPTSRAGDWQFYGKAQMPHKICGTWKYGTKDLTTSKLLNDGSYNFNAIAAANPDYTLRNAAGTNWDLGAGSDPLPIPSISAQNAVNPGRIAGLGLDLYGAEIAWNFNLLSPPLNPSHSYRLQFMVHDGDQTRIGGDVGQACIGITAACPPGFTGKDCTNCDLYPPPGNAWTWFCYYTGGAQVYNLIKVPTSKLSQVPYNDPKNFVPGTAPGGKDPAGYIISCNCTRTIIPCPQQCCGNGVCDDRTGTCTCRQQQNQAGIPADPKSCCIQPLPPCYNNGSFCSGNGNCNVKTGVCNCQTLTDGSRTTGASCNIIIPPPIPPPPPKIPCPLQCCGNGNCDDTRGVCTCTTQSPFLNASTCCIGPSPPCYNNGNYCSGKGNCNLVTKACDCVTNPDGSTYTGAACNVTVPAPPAPAAPAPSPPMECPKLCCGNGVCNTRTGVCTCTDTTKTFDPSTCCIIIVIPDCYNGGQFCSGKGTCNNGTCVCNPTTDGSKVSGAACNITVPPTPPTCSTLNNTNDCQSCQDVALAYGLSCSWCAYKNDSTQFSAGKCVASNGTCPSNNLLPNCIPPAIFIPPPCPDACSGNGECKNVTGNGNNATNTTQICVCFDGYSGINCGVGTSTAVVVAAAASGGIIAAIVIAAVLVVACAGGGAYAVVNGAGGGPAAVVTNNPIYAGSDTMGDNPLYNPHARN